MPRRAEATSPEDSRWTDALVTVDVATSAARAAAFDLDGNRRLATQRPYPSHSPRPGWAEQDPRAWQTAAVGALGDLVRKLGPRRRVLGIGLTGQCPTICLVDARGKPTSPGLMYRDNRAEAEAAAMRERFGDTWIHARTGHLPAAFHIAPKLLWIRAHEPEWLRAAALALQPRDLAALVLTGEPATDGTHAAATLVYDLRRGDWDPELLEALGFSQSLFPPVRPSAAVVGTIRPALAARLKLPPSTPVVLGGADSQACALGAGVVRPGPVSEMAGSSTCLNAAVREPLAELLVTHYPHVVPGVYTTETGINTTGTAVAWIADLLYGGRRSHARAADFERLDLEAGQLPPGADGVLSVPVLGDGERTDPDLRAAFTGLSLRHGRAALARAVLEGVAFTIRSHLALLTSGGAPVTELRVSGGDSRLGTWNRIKADVIGVPVTVVPGDAAVTGVAMLAGLGTGVYRDVDDAIDRCLRFGDRLEPDPTTRDAYDERFAAFQALSAAEVARHRSEEGSSLKGQPSRR
jgi:xylulokinase